MDSEKSKLEDYLAGTDNVIYSQISFGLLRCQDPEQFQKILKALSGKEADLIDSFFVERKCVYYRLNRRMARILKRLLEADLYHGKLFRTNLCKNCREE